MRWLIDKISYFFWKHKIDKRDKKRYGDMQKFIELADRAKRCGWRE